VWATSCGSMYVCYDDVSAEFVIMSADPLGQWLELMNLRDSSVSGGGDLDSHTHAHTHTSSKE